MIKYKVEVKGPLECHANDIYEELLSQRYTELSIRNRMYALADLSRWLKRNHLSLSQFGESEVHCFLATRKRKFTGIVTLGSFSSILRFFWKNKLIPKWKAPKKKVTRLDLLIESYVRYLFAERGLAAGTIAVRKKEAHEFLKSNPVKNKRMLCILYENAAESNREIIKSAMIRGLKRFCLICMEEGFQCGTKSNKK